MCNMQSRDVVDELTAQLQQCARANVPEESLLLCLGKAEDAVAAAIAAGRLQADSSTDAAAAHSLHQGQQHRADTALKHIVVWCAARTLAAACRRLLHVLTSVQIVASSRRVHALSDYAMRNSEFAVAKTAKILRVTVLCSST